MKHDNKLHHWITLLSQLELKLANLQKLTKNNIIKVKKDDKNTSNLLYKLSKKHTDIVFEIYELTRRINQIKSQIDQY